MTGRHTSGTIGVRMEQARNAGSWMPWAGAGLATCGWAGAGAWIYSTMGLEGLTSLSPLTLAGAGACIVTPGLALIVGGLMARESRRSSEANAIVLSAARQLLAPAERSSEQVSTLAEGVARETAYVNRALSETRDQMDDMKRDIDASVTSALKAAEAMRIECDALVARLSAERESLSSLSGSLQQQADTISAAIPRHAQVMAEAARLAEAEVAKADHSLDLRLKSIGEAASLLAQRIEQLDTMGAESRKRVQLLANSLARLDEQMIQSTRMVDAAVRAGELAAVASKGTADALRDAVNDALDSALKTSETIAAKSAGASLEARDAMERLKEVGLQAEAIAKSAMIAARTQADETEARVAQLSDAVYQAATRATQAAETGLDRARQRIEQASRLLNGLGGDDPALTGPAPASTTTPLALSAASPIAAFAMGAAELQRGAPGQKPVASADRDAVSGGLRAETVSPAPALSTPLKPPVATPPASPKPATNANGRVEPRPFATLAPGHVFSPRKGSVPPGPDGGRSGGLSWRELLTGVEEAPLELVEEAPASPPVPAVTPEAAASTVMARLDKAGVRLTAAMRPSDLRRIATAAHSGERHRRRATRDAAPNEIQRVSRLLDQDPDLQEAARHFVAVEASRALDFLTKTERSRMEPHPRLSAYLLLDAALGAII